MLPITTHRSFHIPHTLAVAAALVALITAFGWTADAPETLVEREPDIGIQSVVEAGADAGGAQTTAASRCGSRGRCLHDHAQGLLPLVLPALPGR